ncbi:hypothetical protein CISIN_1g034405mg [Citrus sinensis]|uniref:Uncharacterized protein n=1 Tax=Citrus sinensis TaxID=2711 RepID=A0A067E625_CITSI|nr:hypothetical protein CISIN_1g034405mg [Citrus sinensis]
MCVCLCVCIDICTLSPHQNALMFCPSPCQDGVIHHHGPNFYIFVDFCLRCPVFRMLRKTFKCNGGIREEGFRFYLIILFYLYFVYFFLIIAVPSL